MQDLEKELIKKTLSKKPFVIIKWSKKYSGLDYSIIKREFCSNFNLIVLNSTFKLNCTVNQFNKEYTDCELIKAGSYSAVLTEYSNIVFKSNTKKTKERNFANTQSQYKRKPFSLSLSQVKDESFDLYYPTIIFDCQCEKCHPKEPAKQKMINKYFRPV